MKLGIPYMGSKRKIAKKLVDFILAENPDCEYVYDLFGGGGAMSFEFASRPEIKRVVYNELNTGVVNLLKKIRDGGVTNEFYDWVTRDQFHSMKSGDDWKSGLIKTCWSFGNGQLYYAYGYDNENLKKITHHVIVECSNDACDDLEKVIGTKIDREMLKTLSMKERRFCVVRYIKSGKIDHHKNQHLEIIEHLIRIDRLDKIKQSVPFSKLEIVNKSYDEVEITTPPEKTVIYLDPPYSGTGTYQLDIDHDDLYDYIDKSKHKIYLSSYESPLEEVLSIEHGTKISQKIFNKVQEKLFTNDVPRLNVTKANPMYEALRNC